MAEEKLYELKKDVSTPNGYWRAGQRGTAAFWKKEFRMSDFAFNHSNEWFLDLSLKEQNSIDELHEVIELIFGRKGLRSITYKEAARDVAEEYLKRSLLKLKTQ